jgi:hypothetical protein
MELAVVCAWWRLCARCICGVVFDDIVPVAIFGPPIACCLLPHLPSPDVLTPPHGHTPL